MCTIFELVCHNQSRKAFELAAAYLQVKKGTKETNKLFHKSRSVMKTEWRCYIKNYLQKSQKTIINMITSEI